MTELTQRLESVTAETTPEELIREHVLKLDTEYFDAVACGAKPFEVRRDDRGFQRGDILILERYGKSKSALKGIYYLTKTGYTASDKSEIARARVRVTYVLTGGQYGIEPGYVVLGIALLKAMEAQDD